MSRARELDFNRIHHQFALIWGVMGISGNWTCRNEGFNLLEFLSLDLICD
jgi:hypothetical protein